MWWKYILYTILAYSFILSIVVVYKDKSKYYDLSILDVIVAGPIAWILLLINIIFKIIFKSNNKKYKYIIKNSKYIKRVVKKIVIKYKHSNRANGLVYLSCSIDIDCSNIYGWKYLIINKPSNEFLNNKFEILMYHQIEDTLNELYKYFEVVDDITLSNNIYNVASYSGKIYKLKKNI